MASTLQSQATVPKKARTRRWWVVALGGAVLVYLVLALWLAYTKTPWCDEGWFANPAYNLAFHGNLGSNVLEPSGFYLNAYFRGVQERTYYVIPSHFIALAAWFRVFGMTAFSARAYSICWGALTLPILFYILQRLFPDRRVAALGTLLTAIDFIFLWSTADTRMEAPANALALCSLAAYLHWREKRYRKAVFYSQILGAAAVFMHPNAALVVLVLGLMAWGFDRQCLRSCRLREVALAAAPYLVFGLLWSVYILRSPADFRAQFLANVAGHNSERFTRILQPASAIISEIDRHLGAYCIGGLWGQVMEGWMGLVPLLYIPAIIWLLIKVRRDQQPLYILATYTVAMAFGMTFLNGFKGYFYLIYVVPLYDAVLSLWLLSLWKRGASGKLIAGFLGLAFVSLQLAISMLHIRADEYHRNYEPTIQEVARDRALGKSIVGTAALGFGLGFTGFQDDVRLGMYSGLSPDVVVIDRAYRMYSGFYATEEPAVFQHIVTLLSKDYKLTAQYGSFWIFERAQTSSDRNLLPQIDMEKMKAIEPYLRAQYFFRALFAAYRLHGPEKASL